MLISLTMLMSPGCWFAQAERRRREESEKSLVSMMFSPGWSAASLAASQPIKGALDREFHHEVIFFTTRGTQPPCPPKAKQKTATNR